MGDESQIDLPGKPQALFAERQRPLAITLRKGQLSKAIEAVRDASLVPHLPVQRQGLLPPRQGLRGIAIVLGHFGKAPVQTDELPGGKGAERTRELPRVPQLSKPLEALIVELFR